MATPPHRNTDGSLPRGRGSIRASSAFPAPAGAGGGAPGGGRPPGNVLEAETKSLSPGELRFVSALVDMPGETARYVAWARISAGDGGKIVKEGGGSKKGGEKGRDILGRGNRRILVAGNFRVFIVKRTAIGGKKNVIASFHIWSIDVVRMPHEGCVVLSSVEEPGGSVAVAMAATPSLPVSASADAQPDDAAGSDEFELQRSGGGAVGGGGGEGRAGLAMLAKGLYIYSPEAAEIVRCLRESYERVSFDFPRTGPPHPCRLLVNVPASYLLPLRDEHLEPIGGYINTYISFCHLLGAPGSRSYVRFLDTAVASRNVVHDLGRCAGIVAKTPATIHLQPVVNALTFNPHFRAFVLRDATLTPEALSFRLLLRFNTTLTKLVLRRLDGAVGWGEIARAIAENADNRLAVLDFSENHIRERDASALAHALARLRHGLHTLALRECGLGPVSIAALFHAFERNYGMSLALEVLDLSHNRFEEVGSRACAEWLEHVHEFAHLRVLRLAGARVSTAIVGSVLSHPPRLAELDLSGNRVDRDATRVLRLLLGETGSVRCLSLAGCGLAAESVHELLSALLSNRRVFDLDIDISANDMRGAPECITRPLDACMEFKYGLRRVDVSSMRLRVRGVITVLQALRDFCMTVADVSVGGSNLAGASPAELVEAARAFADFLEGASNVKRFSIAGDGKGAHFRNHALDHFLRFLGTPNAAGLEELDISRNAIGDASFILLVDALYTNTGLRVLRCDGSGLTLNALLALRACLAARGGNLTLRTVDYADDLDAALAQAPRGPGRRALLATFAEIEAVLRRNARAAHRGGVASATGAPGGGAEAALAPADDDEDLDAEADDDDAEGEDAEVPLAPPPLVPVPAHLDKRRALPSVRPDARGLAAADEGSAGADAGAGGTAAAAVPQPVDAGGAGAREGDAVRKPRWAGSPADARRLDADAQAAGLLPATTTATATATAGGAAATASTSATTGGGAAAKKRNDEETTNPFGAEEEEKKKKEEEKEEKEEEETPRARATEPMDDPIAAGTASASFSPPAKPLPAKPVPLPPAPAPEAARKKPTPARAEPASNSFDVKKEDPPTRAEPTDPFAAPSVSAGSHVPPAKPLPVPEARKKKEGAAGRASRAAPPTNPFDAGFLGSDDDDDGEDENGEDEAAVRATGTPGAVDDDARKAPAEVATRPDDEVSGMDAAAMERELDELEEVAEAAPATAASKEKVRPKSPPTRGEKGKGGGESKPARERKPRHGGHHHREEADAQHGRRRERREREKRPSSSSSSGSGRRKPAPAAADDSDSLAGPPRRAPPVLPASATASGSAPPQKPLPSPHPAGASSGKKPAASSRSSKPRGTDPFGDWSDSD